jgi:Tol biopolymer transport system component/DNA-binding winged helix-turn-helix (wHTH) protein
MNDPQPAVRAYRFGPYALDPSRRTLTRGADPVPIAGKAFDVLLVLLERHGQVVEKAELLRLVWPDTIVEEANLSQQIFMLRKLLGEAPDRRSYIATAPKRGYGFFGDVQVEAPASAPAPAATDPSARPDLSTVRLTMTLPASAPLALLATSVIDLSPDGQRIVYVGAADGSTRLYLRDLDSFETRPLTGTEGAANPFFSPDGFWVGFASAQRLRRISISGGAPQTICQIDGDIRGASWGQDDHIVFAPGPASGLWRVAAHGGVPQPLTTLAFDAGERTHRWPHVLPDGRGVIFTIGSEGASSFDEGIVAVTEPEGRHRVILYHGCDARYSPSGHLIYARRSALLKTPFDLETLLARGSGRAVLSGVATAATGAARFALSTNGTLAYVTGETQTLRRSLVLVNHQGEQITSIHTGEGLEEPRLSGDGRRIVLGLRGRHTNLWLYDFEQAPMLRLTFEGDNFAAIWGPDGETVTFSSNRGGACDLYILRPESGAAAELLVSTEFDKVPGTWAADGSTLVYTEYNPESGADIWAFDASTGKTRALRSTRFNEYAPAFSPDGTVLAYTSDETGRPEVYATRYPECIERWQLSTDGGCEPLWMSNGQGLIYRNGDRLMLVDLALGPAQAGVPRTLFEGRYVPGTLTGLANYDRGTEPDSFLMLREDEPPRPDHLSVVLNWFGELRAKNG